ncbi:unnamed protein product [Brachionus calyciflorus]|uniref:Uncharacterized protein n=1 Tax=Brachionus calyciflorus TaxID=104777 RepID=A0A813U2Z8_9BILA|nr:unnamed protein product [Brachionus calyciflorus]
MCKITWLYHVTSEQNKEEILNDKMIKANKADDSKYDGLLSSSKEAPCVCFFSGSYYKDKLPTISPYPRCKPRSKVCKYKDSLVHRIRIPVKHIIDQLIEEKLRIFFVRKHEKGAKKYYLFLFVDTGNIKALKWAETSLTSKCFDKVLNIDFQKKELRTKSIEHNVTVNFAFSFNINLKLTKTDTVKHSCPLHLKP